MRNLLYLFFFFINSFISSVKYRCASDLGIPHLCLKITYEDKKQVKYVGGCREDQYCYDSLNEKNELRRYFKKQKELSAMETQNVFHECA